MELSSYITAFATVVLAGITFYYAKITNKMMKFSYKALEEQTRPYVVAEFIVNNYNINFRIRNIGHRSAHNISIAIDPKMDDILLSTNDQKRKWVDYEPLLQQTFMAPGYELLFLINLGFRFLEYKEKDKRYLYTVTINYSDSNERVYKEVINLDLDAIYYKDTAINWDHNHFLEGIDKSLKEIKEDLAKIINK